MVRVCVCVCVCLSPVNIEYNFCPCLVLPNEKEVLYIRSDLHHRPFQVWLHQLGQEQQNDILLFEDERPRYEVN